MRLLMSILGTLGRGLVYTVLGIACLAALGAIVFGPAFLFHQFVTDVQIYVVGFLGLWVAFLLGLTVAVMENFN
jgi:uncharacterized integral membrane protein